MRRRSRGAALLAAWVLVVNTVLVPQGGWGYQVPLNEPPMKGDPDDPGHWANPAPRPVEPISWQPRIVVVVQLPCGGFLPAVIRLPSQSRGLHPRGFDQ